MKDFLKNKIATIGILIATLVLAGVAVFTAIRLYQLRQQAVAPTAPTSKPKAAEVPKSCTTLAFNLGTPTPTPTGSESPTPTPPGSGSPTPTPTPTNTPGQPNSCGGTCGSNANCNSGLTCYQGFCRNPSCQTSQNCVCPPGVPTPPPSQPTLPNSGTSLPSILGVGLGSILLIGAILLAL